jgi:hypothetical protein
MNDRLKWIEDEVRRNAEFHVVSADALVRKANVTLNLLLTGAGGALAYMVSLFERSGWHWATVGVGAVSAYLFMLAALVVLKCLQIQPIWPTANEPNNLHQPDFDFIKLREFELRSKQRCIDHNCARNDLVSMWLNRVRVGISIAPIVFLLAAALVC